MRKLLYHPESDDLFEVFNEKDYVSSLECGPCDDVSGIEEFEKRFKELKGFTTFGSVESLYNAKDGYFTEEDFQKFLDKIK